MTASNRASLLERRANELRLDIARRAMDLFIADGDTSATVERIAEAAGVAPRTFYRHFAVKEDVVVPLFRRSSQRIAASIRSASAQQDLVDLLVRAFRDDLQPDRVTAEQRAFLGLMLSNPQYRMRWVEVDGSLREAIGERLDAQYGVNTDPFVRDLAAELLAHSARRAFEAWLSSAQERDVEEFLAKGFEVVLVGLSGDAGT